MANDSDKCPARDGGGIAGCRSCKWTGGAPSSLCIKMREAWIKEQQEKQDDERQ